VLAHAEHRPGLLPNALDAHVGRVRDDCPCPAEPCTSLGGTNVAWTDIEAREARMVLAIILC
jgi:hypothetical protein